MNSITLAASILLFTIASLAQNASPPAAVSVKKPGRENKETAESRSIEQQNLIRLQEKIRRDHSDASGRVRPDLRGGGVAQMQRMKVTNQIGQRSKDSAEK